MLDLLNYYRLLHKINQTIFYLKNGVLVLANGFYEWQEINKKKVPFRFALTDDEPFGLAGLYLEHNNNLKFSIITTQANKSVSKYHDRMPAILPLNHEKEWLLDKSVDELLKMLNPFEDNILQVFNAPLSVNSPRYDDHDILSPLIQENLI